jgi:tripartite-type tricarboxylate transporter receptor subunit TctC
MRNTFKRILFRILAILMVAVSTGLHAESWPSRPIQIVVPYAPGGIGDIVARLIQPMLQDALKTSIIVVNKVGASGSLGTEYVARSAPDGYTLLLGLAAPQTLNQFIYKVRYDGYKDFAPITLINTNPMVLMANSSLPVKTVPELIAYAKANPGKLNFSGAGGLTQYSGEIFKHMTSIDMTAIQYKGGSPAVAAVVAGDVQLTFANYSDALQWMKSGRLRPIALTSAKRYPQTPEIPTIAESGLPGYDVEGWSGLFAPAGTPPEIVRRIQSAVEEGFKSQAVRKKFYDLGAIPGGNPTKEFRAFVQSEVTKWGDFVERTGIKVE